MQRKRLYLYRSFIGYVGDEEIHRNVLTIHVIVHPFFDVARHGGGVHVTPVL